MIDSPDSTRRKFPRIAVFNDSAPTLSTIAKCCEIHGYGVVTAQVSQMRFRHVDVETFVTKNRPDVIVFDVAMPYESNWDFLDVIRLLPMLAGIPIVVTTANKVALEALIGPSCALQIIGKPGDLNTLLAQIDAAVV